jgi:hypothetical protein
LGDGGCGEEEGEQDGGEPNPNRHGRLRQIGSGAREEAALVVVFGFLQAVWIY